MVRLAPLLAALFVLLVSCGTGTTGTDPLPFTVQEYIDGTASSGSYSLAAKAVKASGVYSALAEEDYPLLLILFGENSILETYLKEQGLTEAEFLAHPKLAEFVKSHLIYDDVDLVALRSTLGASASFKSAAGINIVIKNVKDSQGGRVMGGTANGVPLSLWCTEDSSTGDGKVCLSDGPVVTDFDWSR